MAEQTLKQSLIADLESARAQLAGYSTALRHDLNVGARLKGGVARNPVAWFGAAAVVGLLLSKIPSPRRKTVIKMPASGKKQAGTAGKAAFALGALKLGLDFAKPAIMSWISKQLHDRMGSRRAGAK